MSDLQREAGKWHETFFLNATPLEVVCKLMEEVGELSTNVLADHGVYKKKKESSSTVEEEAADVLLSLFILISRWYPHANILAEAEKKLDKIWSTVNDRYHL